MVKMKAYTCRLAVTFGGSPANSVEIKLKRTVLFTINAQNEQCVFWFIKPSDDNKQFKITEANLQLYKSSKTE